jgi:surface protein
MDETTRQQVIDDFGNIEDWDVSQVTNMRILFEGYNLDGIDLTKWDTARVRNMGGMFTDTTNFNNNIFSSWKFYECENIYNFLSNSVDFNNGGTDIILSNDKISNINSMFSGCKNLNVSISFNLSGLVNADNCFQGCSKLNNNIGIYESPKLESLVYFLEDATNFDGNLQIEYTSNLRNIEGIFEGLEKFSDKENNLPNWDVRNLQNSLTYDWIKFPYTMDSDLSGWVKANPKIEKALETYELVGVTEGEKKNNKILKKLYSERGREKFKYYISILNFILLVSIIVLKFLKK